jgi:NHLM bacteriocin system ABC transporter ATP-binding protein
MASARPVGETVVAQGATPLPLDQPDRAWVVVEGSMDVFAIARDGGARQYLWSAEPGDLLPLVPSDDSRVRLLGVGLGGTRLQPLSRDSLRQLSLAPAIERLVAAVGAVLQTNLPAALHEILEPGRELVLRADHRAGARDRTVWIRHMEGHSLLADSALLPLGSTQGWVPLAGLWVTATGGDARLQVVDTPTCLEAGGGADGLSVLMGFLRAWLEAQAHRDEAEAAGRLETKAAAESKLWQRGLDSLAGLLHSATAGSPETRVSEAPLLAACRATGAAAGIAFREPPQWETALTGDVLASICRSSRVRSRRVALRGRWWLADAGPLLAHLEEGQVPVALLPTSGGRYELLDPQSGARRPVTADVAGELAPFAVTFYRPLPEDTRSLRSLLALALPLARTDLVRIAWVALASGVLALALPVATAQIFGKVIPNARPNDLWTLFATLAAAAVGTALFDVSRAFALTRTEGRVSAALQAALLDRLLALPVPFFRRFAVGDLSQRAGAIQALQETVSTVSITTLVVSVFSSVNLAVLFYYSWRLALAALGLVALAAAANAALIVASVRLERRQQEVQGHVVGLVFQMIGGIAKLRVAGAEGRAFSVWCRSFAQESALAHRAGSLRAMLNVFNDVLPVACSGVLYAMAGYLIFDKAQAFDTGAFVGFAAAFGAMFAAGVAFSNTVAVMVAAVPILERAAPIVETGPEITEAKGDPGALRGLIEGVHLSFRYQPDGPLVLDDVSFRAAPGEFVAFVGPSGSGKSTTLRLLLGFETPESGAIHYDGQNLASLDLSAIRNHQLGVVLQSSRLLSGDIFANIVGSSMTLTQEDAWNAAEMAGLAEDIRSMPMGMHTVVSEGGTTLSGGQRQRLLIARALVRKPRVILFDEATSSLDNRTQETVTRTLELSNATRLVIAHRLSTIRKADRIYVMQAGRVVEEGTFETLSHAGGLFGRLIARQQA